MTLRVRKRESVEGRSHNYGFRPKSSLRGAIVFKEKLIRLGGYPKPYQMVVHAPIVSRRPIRGGLDSVVPSPRTPARAGRALRLVATMSGSLVRVLLVIRR